MSIKAILLRTIGTNCDYETKYVLKNAGFDVDVVHINELIGKKKKIHDYNFLCVPGGFADGDYLGSASVLANKLKYKLGGEIKDFINNGNLVLGICNGFQALVKSGILPGFNRNYSKREVTITFNNSGHFQDEWVQFDVVNKNKCVFTQGLNGYLLEAPINHGEGKFDAGNELNLRKLYEEDQIVFKYVKNPNGSQDDIAGICDSTGRVLGLMPHPEKNFINLQNPQSTRTELPFETNGMSIFRKAFEYLNENL